MRKLCSVLFAAAALVGCTGSPAPVTTSTMAADDAQTQVGDVAVHASVVQTSTLDEAVAREYGLERSDRVALLLVSARRDGDTALPASLKIEARVSDSSGASARPIVLHEVRSGELVDYVGAVDIAPPDSLRFDVVITYETASATLQFTRNFFPR